MKGAWCGSVTSKSPWQKYDLTQNLPNNLCVLTPSACCLSVDAWDGPRCKRNASFLCAYVCVWCVWWWIWCVYVWWSKQTFVESEDNLGCQLSPLICLRQALLLATPYTRLPSPRASGESPISMFHLGRNARITHSHYDIWQFEINSSHCCANAFLTEPLPQTQKGTTFTV